MEQPQVATEDIEKCYICLCQFQDQTVGSLEKCHHVFCLECIVQWSKTANTCPVDRTPFTIIHQKKRIGGGVQKKIKVTPPRSPDDDDDEEEEEGPAVICETCGRSDRRNRILVCCYCESGYHMNCLRPAVSERPDGTWVCSECQHDVDQPGNLADEVGISDGELEELWSDVGEMTSSRLRSSNSNHSGSGSARRSERVQTRSHRDPSAPQAITIVTPITVDHFKSKASKQNMAEHERDE